MKLEYNKDSNVGIAPFGYDPTSKLIITKYIMTPKEKALELVKKHTIFLGDNGALKEYWTDELDAKRHAIISVDELIKEEQETDAYYEIGSYWEEVKQEIENI